jgi:hypothetical protein
MPFRFTSYASPSMLYIRTSTKSKGFVWFVLSLPEVGLWPLAREIKKKVRVLCICVSHAALICGPRCKDFAWFFRFFFHADLWPSLQESAKSSLLTSEFSVLDSEKRKIRPNTLTYQEEEENIGNDAIIASSQRIDLHSYAACPYFSSALPLCIYMQTALLNCLDTKYVPTQPPPQQQQELYGVFVSADAATKHSLDESFFSLYSSYRR